MQMRLPRVIAFALLTSSSAREPVFTNNGNDKNNTRNQEDKMQNSNFSLIKNRLINPFKTHAQSIQKDRQATQYVFLIIGLSLLIHIVCITSTVLLAEEAYYWNYAQHLDFSYLDHPPMVALLIKLSTSVLGTHEFGVRMISLVCWMLMAFFSYKQTQLINKGSGPYALMLLAILPFFVLHSVVITPDVPLIACWSASLYCLYRALTLNESNFWYAAGIWLGLGMLSKYTISLLGIATLFYMLIIPTARLWFRRKEPYLCALIAAFIFTPVIYWNATHHWVSFVFQSSRRFASISSFHLPQLIGLSLLFLMPIGIYGFWKLVKKGTLELPEINAQAKHFMRIYTLIPLGFFALFSLNHSIKFNWIGPIFLALLPWLAALIANDQKKRPLWLKSSVFLVICYGAILLIGYANKSEVIQEKLLKDVIAWDTLTEQFHEIAKSVEAKTKAIPTFVPLDNYRIGSELSFYQAKFLTQGNITNVYPIAGAHILGGESLMYRYWSKKEDFLNKPLILITTDLQSFNTAALKQQIIELSEAKKVDSVSQGQGIISTPYYYKVVQLKQ
ncbi:glycosyltransferase family 39 protein [Legionella maioricensis]|uniref:Glycosyltransferase family 39 protein n=1 Tax=Legionella maioricensis TaxID=2896528 RepID=A0A9X2IB48_9GAMM|nr:glycosyltransferase family 39 protein [Legionella maioricensis]MCL9683062.1 glycosyltransferase family 39 protein [Legionella maioricensis]MCL9686410.1 glycosyltransferase family 39 protein [Legionella maioricensis]